MTDLKRQFDTIYPDPNYTPAPWVAVMDRESLFVDRIESNEVIASLCWPANLDEARMLANAHLISAAPDLFEALRCAVDDDDLATLEGMGSMSRDTKKKVRAAIAKAQGEDAK